MLYDGSGDGRRHFTISAGFASFECRTTRRPQSIMELSRFVGLLFKQWWFTTLAVLGVISTLATFVPAFYTRFSVPRWAGLLALMIAFFVASFRVYADERRRNNDEGKVARDRISELEQQVSTLSIRPYDEQKRTAAHQTLARCSVRERDLLRYLLLHGKPMAQNVRIASRLNDNDSNEVIRQLVRYDLVRRDEDELHGITRFFVNPDWVEVYRDLLFPRNEPENPSYYAESIKP